MSSTSSPLVQRVSERDANRGAHKSAQQAVTLRTTVWLPVDEQSRSHQLCQFLVCRLYGQVDSGIDNIRVVGSSSGHHALTASTIDNGLSVVMTRDSRKPAPRSSFANSAFVRSRPRGVSTSISRSSSLP